MKLDAIRSPRAGLTGSMPDSPTEPNDSSRETGAIDYDVLDRIGKYLERSDRFGEVSYQPEYAPNSIVAEFDRGFLPPSIEQPSLQIRWYDTDDFDIHYLEQYGEGESWECRWDRHPNEHNSRGHFHPPPDADKPGDDENFPSGWRDVMTVVVRELDQRRTDTQKR
jgi:hypothetical protein